jgi:hypothetical protein
MAYRLFDCCAVIGYGRPGDVVEKEASKGTPFRNVGAGKEMTIGASRVMISQSGQIPQGLRDFMHAGWSAKALHPSPHLINCVPASTTGTCQPLDITIKERVNAVIEYRSFTIR